MHPPSPARRFGAVCALAMSLAVACQESSDSPNECADLYCLDAGIRFDAGYRDGGLDGGTLITLPDGGVIVIPGPSPIDASVYGDGGAPSADGGDAGNGNGGLTLPCAVQTVFDTYCKTCHAPNAIGGFELATLADLRAPSKSAANVPTYASVVDRLTTQAITRMMPPAGTASRPSSEDVALVTSWAAQGAPPGASCDVPDAGAADAGSDAGNPPDSGAPDSGTPDAGKPDSGTPDSGTPDSGTPPAGLTCYRFLAHANNNLTAKYRVGVANDAYVNMTFTPPWQGTVYAQTFSPVTDNGTVLHHWLFFKDNTMGTGGSVSPSNGQHPSGELVFGWAPGGSTLDLRGTATGLALEGNTSYTMEYHYNSNNANAEDQSGIELCVSSTAPANVATQSWLGSERFNPPATTWSGTCRPSGNQRIHLVAINPHMHKDGRHLRAVINRAAGGTTVLHDADFDFNYQQTYTKDVWLEVGDTVTTTCTYAAPQSWGQATTKEMCYLFTMATPAGALSDGNAIGQYLHGENTCLGNPVGLPTQP